MLLELCSVMLLRIPSHFVFLKDRFFFLCKFFFSLVLWICVILGMSPSSFMFHHPAGSCSHSWRYMFCQVQVADVDWIKIMSGEEISLMVCLLPGWYMLICDNYYNLLSH